MSLDVKSLLSRLTYQPNVEIEYNPIDFDAGLHGATPRLRVSMWVLDARQTYPDSRNARRIFAFAMYGGEGELRYRPDEVVYPGKDEQLVTLYISPQRVTNTLQIPWPIYESNGELGEMQFYEWLDRMLLETLVKHEHREWFQVDGKPFHDPHPKRGWATGDLKPVSRNEFEEMRKLMGSCASCGHKSHPGNRCNCGCDY